MNSKSNKIDKCKWWEKIKCVIKVAICCSLPKGHTVRNIKCLLRVEVKKTPVTNALLSLIVGKVMSYHL